MVFREPSVAFAANIDVYRRISWAVSALVASIVVAGLLASLRLQTVPASVEASSRSSIVVGVGRGTVQADSGVLELTMFSGMQVRARVRVTLDPPTNTDPWRVSVEVHLRSLRRLPDAAIDALVGDARLLRSAIPYLPIQGATDTSVSENGLVAVVLFRFELPPGAAPEVFATSVSPDFAPAAGRWRIEPFSADGG